MSQICINSTQLAFLKLYRMVILLHHFACLILARNYNSPRTISVKVITLAVFILLRLVFTGDGVRVRVRVVIKSVELFDLVKTVF